MALGQRLQKFRYLIDEMNLGLMLARSAPDDFSARMLSRHVLVRAENFIAHARALRRPLNLGGFDTTSFHRDKEDYFKYFEEYFGTARHRLGAHIQDLDFGRRLELWTDIETVKVSYFIEAAEQIYSDLKGLGIPGYVQLAELPELSDANLSSTLAIYRISGRALTWVEAGLDPLAMTRPSSGAVLNMTPIHSRASQLAMIRRWMVAQEDLLARVGAFPRLIRILKARMVTDVVSFCDCLITRPVPAGALQAMDGLDALVAKESQSTNPIDVFKNSYRYGPELDRFRDMRNKVGGHLDEDTAASLSSLLLTLDELDMQELSRFYDLLNRLFEKTCRAVDFLRVYLADGKRLFGVLPGRILLDKPFDSKANRPAANHGPMTEPIDSDTEFRDALNLWLTGTADERDEGRYQYFEAFLSSTVVESFQDEEHLGTGVFFSVRKITRAHEFIKNSLLAAKSNEEFKQILLLMRSCSGGDSKTLAEVLHRLFKEPNTPLREIALCFYLGELAGWEQSKIVELLKKRASGPDDNPFRLHATLALFKIYVRTVGHKRINGKIAPIEYAKEIQPLLIALSDTHRLFYYIVLASQFCGQALATFQEPLCDEYEVLRAEIGQLAPELVPELHTAEISSNVSTLLKSNDYVGICLVLGGYLKYLKRYAEAQAFLSAACTGLVLSALHDNGRKNLALCYAQFGDHQSALALAEDFASKNPDDVGAQLFVVQILIEDAGAFQQARLRLDLIKAQRTIGPNYEALHQAIEAKLAANPSTN